MNIGGSCSVQTCTKQLNLKESTSKMMRLKVY